MVPQKVRNLLHDIEKSVDEMGALLTESLQNVETIRLHMNNLRNFIAQLRTSATSNPLNGNDFNSRQGRVLKRILNEPIEIESANKMSKTDGDGCGSLININSNMNMNKTEGGHASTHRN